MGARGNSILLAVAVISLAGAPAVQSAEPPPPDTVLLGFPQNPSPEASTSFTYAELPDEAGATFECKLDSEAFAPCPESGISYPGPLTDGPHTFTVRAIGEGGEDPSPETVTWWIDTVAPETTITASPSDPSSGFVAGFGFASSEPHSSFRCQLDQGAIQLCANSASSGSRSYFSLADGSHTFRVYATDNAGNADPTPAERTFTVQTILGDRAAPDTSILSGPQGTTASTTVFFTYGSSEPGSSFECRLGSAPFAPCPAGGRGFGPLKNAGYSFEVRATDAAGNADSVPAVFAFAVRAPLPDTRFVKAPPGTVRTAAKRAARLRFVLAADRPGSSFRCRLDRQRFRPCEARLALRVPRGRHRFEAYAVDALGNVETTPARRIVRVTPKHSRDLF